MSGKRNGCKIWESVAPIFSRAKVKTNVIVTRQAGHASHVIASITNEELNLYDGVVAVGGDGFFNEILNGFLPSRHKAPYPPIPPEFAGSIITDRNVPILGSNEIVSKISYDNKNEDCSPLLPCSRHNRLGFSNIRNHNGSCDKDGDTEFTLPNDWFRFGIIPAGSTDAIVICTTGARDPITSALHIILGKKVCLDIAQVVRWKLNSVSQDEPCVRYAVSFAGYGFYGDVITESEKYRWMGPKRYDYAGTKVFLRHRSYEAEVAYLEVNPDETKVQVSLESEEVICRVNCNVCTTKTMQASTSCMKQAISSQPETSKWLKSRGRFLSIGAAIISCRNEKAPDGLVAHAHLSDGFLHLILIRDCPHAYYLWHLTELAKKGGNPLKFDFVEHHKIRTFTFTSFGNSESVWNLDGELFNASQLSAQVFRGLINLFATGPEL